MPRRLSLVVVLLAAVMAGCGDDEPTGNQQDCETMTGPTVHDSDINTSETWTKCGNPHIVSGVLDVQAGSATDAAPILTLGPGVEVRFATDAAAGTFRFFRVGYFEAGGLVINGTAAEPVVIKSNAATAAPGDYTGIVFMSNTTGSSIKHLTIQDCGESPSLSSGLDGCIVAQGSPTPILMQNVTVNRSKTKGVVFAEGSEFATGSQNVSVSNAATFPMLVDPVSAHTLPSGGTYASNGRNFIQLDGITNDIVESASWINPGIPYLVENLIDIDAMDDASPAPVLTIAPGTTFRMARDSRFRIGYFYGGALVADGTPTQKITFTADTATAGFWVGIEVAENATSSMLLDNVIVEYGGAFIGYVPGDEANVFIRPDLPAFITNSIFRNSAACGIVIGRYQAEGGFVDYSAISTGNTFSSNADGNLCGLY